MQLTKRQKLEQDLGIKAVVTDISIKYCQYADFCNNNPNPEATERSIICNLSLQLNNSFWIEASFEYQGPAEKEEALKHIDSFSKEDLLYFVMQQPNYTIGSTVYSQERLLKMPFQSIVFNIQGKEEVLAVIHKSKEGTMIFTKPAKVSGWLNTRLKPCK